MEGRVIAQRVGNRRKVQRAVMLDEVQDERGVADRGAEERGRRGLADVAVGIDPPHRVDMRVAAEWKCEWLRRHAGYEVGIVDVAKAPIEKRVLNVPAKT